jgi:hypothetical protein
MVNYILFSRDLREFLGSVYLHDMAFDNFQFSKSFVNVFWVLGFCLGVETEIHKGSASRPSQI